MEENNIAAEIRQANKRRNAALERGGITLHTQIDVLAVQNNLFSQVRELRANFDDILWRWKVGFSQQRSDGVY